MPVPILPKIVPILPKIGLQLKVLRTWLRCSELECKTPPTNGQPPHKGLIIPQAQRELLLRLQCGWLTNGGVRRVWDNKAEQWTQKCEAHHIDI